MAKKRTSRYVPEHEATRTTKQVLLRVAPDVAETFEGLAEEDGTTKVATFTALVTKERARRDRK